MRGSFPLVKRGNPVHDPRCRQNDHTKMSDSSQKPDSPELSPRAPVFTLSAYFRPRLTLGHFATETFSKIGLVAP